MTSRVSFLPKLFHDSVTPKVTYIEFMGSVYIFSYSNVTWGSISWFAIQNLNFFATFARSCGSTYLISIGALPIIYVHHYRKILFCIAVYSQRKLISTLNYSYFKYRKITRQSQHKFSVICSVQVGLQYQCTMSVIQEPFLSSWQQKTTWFTQCTSRSQHSCLLWRLKPDIAQNKIISFRMILQ